MSTDVGAPHPPDRTRHPAGVARVVASVAVLVLLLALTATGSLLWWRTDALDCDCEWCPDGYCDYAEAIHGALVRRGAEPTGPSRLSAFASAYTHAHSPLAPVLTATGPMRFGLTSVAGFALVSGASTLAAWIAVRRAIATVVPLSGVARALVLLAFLANPLVVRTFVRPQTDAVGLACTAWALYLLQRHLVAPNRSTGVALFAAQLVGMFSRVSFFPMLALPALATVALARGVPIRTRLSRGLRSALCHGVLPGIAFLALARFFGIDNLERAWAFGQQAAFKSGFTFEAFWSGVQLVGLPLVALAVAGGVLARAGTAALVWRMHALWVIVYVAFLLSGRTSLWPRYLVPIVPSLVVAATPALARLAARGAVGTTLALVALLVPALRAADHVAPRVGPAWDLLSASIEGSVEWEAKGDGFARTIDPSRVTITRSLAADGALVDQLTLDSPRRLRAIRFRDPPGRGLPAFVIEGTRNGHDWLVLADPEAARARAGFFAPHPGTIVELRRGGRLRGVRIRWLGGEATSPQASTVLFPGAGSRRGRALSRGETRAPDAGTPAADRGAPSAPRPPR